VAHGVTDFALYTTAESDVVEIAPPPPAVRVVTEPERAALMKSAAAVKELTTIINV